MRTPGFSGGLPRAHLENPLVGVSEYRVAQRRRHRIATHFKLGFGIQERVTGVFPRILELHLYPARFFNEKIVREELPADVYADGFRRVLEVWDFCGLVQFE